MAGKLKGLFILATGFISILFSFDTFYRGVLLKDLQWAEMGFSSEYLEAIEACLYGGEK